MDVHQLKRQYIDYAKSLYGEGFLDDQFAQLQNLQDESNPDFVVEVTSLFFDDSQNLLNNMTKALQQPVVDFKHVDSHVHQFKGSSSSIGASRFKNICILFRNYCEAQNLQGCFMCIQQLRQEYSVFKNKVEILLRLEQQIRAAGGTVPVLE